MAGGAANPNWNGTLAAATIDTVTLAAGPNVYEIVNVDGTSRIDYTLDGSAPVVGGNTKSRVLPAVPFIDVVNVKSDGSTVIKLISAGTPKYAIQAQAGPEV
jgi:hypothetical protein